MSITVRELLRLPHLRLTLAAGWRKTNLRLSLTSSAPVAVSPAFKVVQPNGGPFQLACATLGGTSPTWSIAPSDGSLGTIDQNGNYTPPSNFPSGINTAVVTATAAQQTASALLCLFDAKRSIYTAKVTAGSASASRPIVKFVISPMACA